VITAAKRQLILSARSLTKGQRSPSGDVAGEERRRFDSFDVEKLSEKSNVLVFLGLLHLRAVGLVPEQQDARRHDRVGQQGADAHHVHELLQIEHGRQNTCENWRFVNFFKDASLWLRRIHGLKMLWDFRS